MDNESIETDWKLFKKDIIPKLDDLSMVSNIVSTASIPLHQLFETFFSSRVNRLAIVPACDYILACISTFQEEFDGLGLFDNYKKGRVIDGISIVGPEEFDSVQSSFDAFFIATKNPAIQDLFRGRVPREKTIRYHEFVELILTHRSAQEAAITVIRNANQVRLDDIQSNWNQFAVLDPLWAIVTDPTKKGNKWDVAEFFQGGGDQIRHLMGELKDSGIFFPTRRALDFGCGVGRLTQPFVSYFDYVYGIDISKEMLALADGYNKNPGRCHYVLSESDRILEFQDNFFDFIFSANTFQHIPPSITKSYLNEFMSLLTPNGLAVFHHPQKFDRPPTRQEREQAARFQSNRPTGPRMEGHGMSPKQVAKIITDANGEIIKFRQIHRNNDPIWTHFQYFVRAKK